ncbi:hypothetical protein I305_00307 [Cryptococcus gattii E566]|uniref:Oxo-4-hydroxy-4-carboxy-5-ureidoimidazoline decarboxylase domain-containing protein n=2 Tax=Cryptococcus gattii TaxID=37769 RepID=E6QY92_CRYGW|nr:Hypothetical protein CGB_A6660W [Cryptococcus gattii WM276]ADV19789.1 Hypothetical protein CGB_A6660W [Cryptococcus gattii WM276]KIR79636.1 hypothetical protein I306_03383 [Cryptococcus gattii EJB2]KIY37212.1 hypothetical protein I305_00307 [Cryptococcus gattii E566]KJE03108.1 hypothetical protein I311_03165 [Cryptococcus gattii NT-10]
MSDDIPPLAALQNIDSLTIVLSTLFEPSPPLHTLLVPSVLERLSSPSLPQSYNQLIDICANVAEGWSWEQKGQFLSGHPMIGEVKGLSKLSGKEQSGGGATPKEVLEKLAHLNQLYCKVYPGLRYITFVNGRTRAQIIPEFESILGLPHSSVGIDESKVPPLNSAEADRMVKTPEMVEWRRECDRGLQNVWLIGRARLNGLDLE